LILWIVSASDFNFIGFKKLGAFCFVLFKLSLDYLYYNNISLLIIFGFLLKIYVLSFSVNEIISCLGDLGVGSISSSLIKEKKSTPSVESGINANVCSKIFLVS